MTRHKHFNAKATGAEQLGFLDAISRTAEIMGVSESGFRLVNNTGLDGGQTVGHMANILHDVEPPAVAGTDVT